MTGGSFGLFSTLRDGLQCAMPLKQYCEGSSNAIDCVAGCICSFVLSANAETNEQIAALFSQLRQDIAKARDEK